MIASLATLAPTTTELDWKWVVDILILLLGFLGAWVMKRLWKEIDDHRKGQEKLEIKFTEQLNSAIHAKELLAKELFEYKLSMPTFYVMKSDLQQMMHDMNRRFDKFERDIDRIVDYFNKKIDKDAS